MKIRNNNSLEQTTMDARIKFWEQVILSGKKYEPRNDAEEAFYEIAEYLVQRGKKEIAA